MKEISQLKDQLSKANKKLDDSLNSKNEEIANLKKKNSDLQSQLSKANKKIDNPSIAQNEEILDLKNENSSLQNQLNKRKKEKEEMVNTYIRKNTMKCITSKMKKFNNLN